MKNINIFKCGVKPTEKTDYTHEELFLSFASFFGVSKNICIHRKAIFNYIQTNGIATSESSLQGSLERSEFWVRDDRAYYKLNDLGLEKLYDEYEIRKINIPIYPIVLFSYKLEVNSIAIKSYPDERDYEIFINSHNVNSKYAYDFLKNNNIVLPDNNTSRPREILTWILSHEYNLEILNYNELLNNIQ